MEKLTLEDICSLGSFIDSKSISLDLKRNVIKDLNDALSQKDPDTHNIVSDILMKKYSPDHEELGKQMLNLLKHAIGDK